MSWYPYNNYQHPPPGWYPYPTTVNPSSSGAEFPRPGLQSICAPHINSYFVPQYYATANQTPPHLPSSLFYNTAQQPAAIIRNLPSYPFQSQGTEQYDRRWHPGTFALPDSSNHYVATMKTQCSNVTERTTSEENMPYNDHTHVEAYAKHKTQYSQQQDQQGIERQEWEIHEEGQTSLRQTQWWPQNQNLYSQNEQHNQSMKKKKQENKNAHRSDYQQRNTHSYINESRELNLPMKNQEQKKHEEEKQKQAQSWRQDQEQHNLDQRQDDVRKKQLRTQKTHQRSRQQWTKQSDIKEDRDLNPPKTFSQCRSNSTRVFSKSFRETHSKPSVTKHMLDTAQAVSAQRSAEEGDNITGAHNSNATLRNHNVRLNKSPSNILNKIHRNRAKGSIGGHELTDSSNPITEFTDLRLNATDVILDEYQSDLNAVIGREGCDVSTLNTPPCFRLLHAGSKANIGVSKGKVFFEAKVTQKLTSSSSVRWDESQPNAARVGWSEEKTSLELGEESMSFGYSSSGKFASNDIYQDYGESFTVNDVICALIDLDSTPATISFMKNGKSFGIAESISVHCSNDKEQLVMFPHVYIKNCKIVCNFGQGKPWFTPPEGYKYIGHLQPFERIHSLKPDSRTQGEVIMLIGLPGAGKTTWAKKHQHENPGKQYYILGTDQLLDKMRVTELPRSSYSERFHKLYNTANECFEKLLDIAAGRRRNCILDQTNVFNRARERKMATFSGFYRIAVVIQPSVQELERRSQERTEKQGKTVPMQTLFEMKTNYSLPLRSLFHEIKYAELGECQVRDLVNHYNKVGC